MILAYLYCIMVSTYMSKKLWLRVGVMGIVLVAILSSIVTAIKQLNNNPLFDLVGETIELSGTIKGDPDLSGETSTARLGNIEHNGESIDGVVFLYGKMNPEPERDDRITVHGKLASGFGTFIGTFYQPKIVALQKPEPGSLALKIRNTFAKSVQDTLGGREAKLGLAYLLGMRNELDDTTLEMLSLVGLTHIVVASGTHLGIIIDFVRRKFGKISRFAGLLFSLVFILVFGQIVGWTASITRAGLVSGFMLLGWYYGRHLGAWRVILIAMAITLTINPMYIVDVGWLLSFASFAGIMILEPMLVEFFYGRKKSKNSRRPGIIANLILASISATLMCMPILLYFFGSISVVSLVANVLILPTIPFAMGLTGLVGLVGFLPNFFVFDWLRFLFVKVSTILLDYHLFVIDFFAKQKNMIVTIDKNNPWVFLLYIFILLPFMIGAIKLAHRRRVAKLRVYENPEKYLPFTASN